MDRQINRKVLYEIADILETYPEHHDQDNWIRNDVGTAGSSIIWNGETISCGTAQCVAGWALILENGGLDGFSMDEEVVFSNGSSFSRYNDAYFIERGAEILGLSSGDADTLFMSTDIEDYEIFDMPRVLREIADGTPVVDAVNWAYDRLYCEIYGDGE